MALAKAALRLYPATSGAVLLFPAPARQEARCVDVTPPIEGRQGDCPARDQSTAAWLSRNLNTALHQLSGRSQCAQVK